MTDRGTPSWVLITVAIIGAVGAVVPAILASPEDNQAQDSEIAFNSNSLPDKSLLQSCIVPSLERLEQSAAEAQLTYLGLQPVRTTEYNTAINAGLVLSQSPEAGHQLTPCTGDVIINISLGPTPTKIPATPTKFIAIKSSNGLHGQSMQGMANQYDNRTTYTMILHVEQMTGNNFIGKLHWPDLQNSITSVNGRVVNDFGGIVERSKWRYVDGYGSEDSGIWLTFTENTLIQGSGILLNVQYFARFSDGVLTGVWFIPNEAEPNGDYALTLVE